MDTVAIAAGQWRMVFPESLYKRLRAHLFPGDGDEHGAVIAAGLARTPAGEMRLLARNLFLATDGQDYIAGKRGYKMLKAEFVRDRVTNCHDEQLVYMAIHNHGDRESVEFSGDDLQSHERGYPALLDIMRGVPVGALVFASDAIAGDIWLPGRRRVKLASATIVGRCRRVLRSAPAPANFSSDPTYDRQARLFGDAGQAILREAKVGIIGLGGVGMLLAEYWGRLGVGHFVLIKPERVAPSNLPRLPGSHALGRSDAGQALKVAGVVGPDDRPLEHPESPDRSARDPAGQPIGQDQGSHEGCDRGYQRGRTAGLRLFASGGRHDESPLSLQSDCAAVFHSGFPDRQQGIHRSRQRCGNGRLQHGAPGDAGQRLSMVQSGHKSSETSDRGSDARRTESSTLCG